MLSPSVSVCTRFFIVLFLHNLCFLDSVSLCSMLSCNKWQCLKLGQFYHKCHFSVPVLVCHRIKRRDMNAETSEPLLRDSGTCAFILSLSSLWSQCHSTLRNLASASVFSSVRILLFCLFLKHLSPFTPRGCRIISTMPHTHFMHLPSALYNRSNWQRQ